MKFALVSNVLPPSSSGQAMVLYQLLKDLDPEDFCLISQQDYSLENPQRKYTGLLHAPYYKISRELKVRYPVQFQQGLLFYPGILLRLFNICTAFIGIFYRGMQIARILRNGNYDKVIACTADLVNFPAGYFASFLTGVSYYAYMFDYYSYQWDEPLSRFFASILEPILIKGAAAIIVPNECLKNELRQRYGVEASVIHNPFDISTEEDEPWPADENEIKIVYTGAIYYAHYDAFLNLVSAIDRLEREDIRLHIYTTMSHRDLEKKGICGPVVYHDHIEQSKIIEVQRHADILFLPLALKSDNPIIIKTSSPGKMGEYLASGRPILVHAPKDSFVSWYFREHGCGVVVDNDNVATLEMALRNIIESHSLRGELASRSRACAKEDFSRSSECKKFLELIRYEN